MEVVIIERKRKHGVMHKTRLDPYIHDATMVNTIGL